MFPFYRTLEVGKNITKEEWNNRVSKFIQYRENELKIKTERNQREIRKLEMELKQLKTEYIE